jgi:hypothetical protein
MGERIGKSERRLREKGRGQVDGLEVAPRTSRNIQYIR